MGFPNTAYITSNGASVASLTCTFGFTPTAGNLLIIAALGQDDEPAGVATPAGYTEIWNRGLQYDQLVPLLACKVSDGTETSITVAMTGNAKGMAIAVLEVSVVGALDQVTTNAANSNAGTLDTGSTGTQATTTGTAIAFWFDKLWAGRTGISYSDGFSAVLNAAGSAFKSPSIWIAAKTLSSNVAAHCTATPGEAFSSADAAIITFSAPITSPILSNGVTNAAGTQSIFSITPSGTGYMLGTGSHAIQSPSSLYMGSTGTLTILGGSAMQMLHKPLLNGGTGNALTTAGLVTNGTDNSTGGTFTFTGSTHKEPFSSARLTLSGGSLTVSYTPGIDGALLQAGGQTLDEDVQQPDTLAVGQVGTMSLSWQGSVISTANVTIQSDDLLGHLSMDLGMEM